jgi:hypothetical protein
VARFAFGTNDRPSESKKGTARRRDPCVALPLAYAAAATASTSMRYSVDTLSTLNGVSDRLDVRSQSTSSLCTGAACNISLQVDCSEGVTPGSTINEVHVISLRG